MTAILHNVSVMRVTPDDIRVWTSGPSAWLRIGDLALHPTPTDDAATDLAALAEIGRAITARACEAIDALNEPACEGSSMPEDVG